MRTPFVHDFGTRYSYSQLLGSLQFTSKQQMKLRCSYSHLRKELGAKNFIESSIEFLSISVLFKHLGSFANWEQYLEHIRCSRATAVLYKNYF